MSIFDSVKENIEANFSEFVKVVDPKSNWTIEDFPYDTGVDETTTNPHCWKCVTVNQCWFKNEKEKRPEEFDYSNYSFTEIPNSSRGLFHPHCHCRKKSINIPKLKDIELIVPDGKIKWLITDKGKWLISMGYELTDVELILSNIYKACKNSYINGDYKIRQHDKYGVKISLYISLPGVNEKKDKYYSLVSSFTIFPNGKLKNNTLVGGKK